MSEHLSPLRALLLIADGLGDRRVPELNGRTPLEAAHTPALDRLAVEGECGLMDPIAPGIRGGSDTGHLSILGYDPYQHYPGRGPFEAMGIGLEVQRGDIAFRCNFSTVDDGMTVVDRRAGRITVGTSQLAAAVSGFQSEGVTCYVKESVAHRAALVMRGADLGDMVSDADPHTERAPVHEVTCTRPGDAASERTARVANAFVRHSYEVLRDHPVNRERRQRGEPPANIILPRGVGKSPNLTPFNELRGVRSACIVEVGLLKGLGKYLGMDVIDVAGSTADLETDTTAIGRAVIAADAGHDFILCNVKGPDVAGHDRNIAGKVAIVEKIDRMVDQIMAAIGDHCILAVTGDHSTPVTYGDHTGEPCPILFSGPTVRRDHCQSFGETACANGGVGRIRGLDVVNILASYMGIQEKYGA
jgi:2,3-bisphosphoglycerate-independent phosphoglycerate mutase